MADKPGSQKPKSGSKSKTATTWKTSSAIWKNSTAILKRRQTPGGVNSQKSKSGGFRWEMLEKSAYRWIALVLVSVLCGILLTPGFSSSSISYDDNWVGKVATKDIRAAADYSIEDLDTTEGKRLEAVSQINPIYEYQVSLGLDIENRVDKAFKLMRDTMEVLILDKLLLNPPEDKVAKKHKKKNVKDAFDLPVLPQDPAQREEELVRIRKDIKNRFEDYFAVAAENKEVFDSLQAKVKEIRSEFNRIVQAVIPEDEFMQLLGFHFSGEIKVALQRIVHDVSTNKIVKDRELLEKGQHNEITVRLIKSNDTDNKPAAEYVLRDLSAILDQNDLNTSIWRYTTVLSGLGSKQRKLLQSIATRIIQPNLVINRSLMNERLSKARQAVKTVIIPIKKGEIIIRDGERFEKRHLTILNGIERELSASNPLLVFLGYFMMCALLIVVLQSFASRNVRKFSPSTKDLLMLTLLTLLYLLGIKSIGAIGSALSSSFPEVPIVAYYYLFPVAVGAALVRVLLNSEVAIVYAIVVALFFALFSTQPFFMGTYALLTSVAAAGSVGQCKTRAVIFFAGLRSALVGMLLVMFYQLVASEFVGVHFLSLVLAAALSGILTSVILLGMAPIIEFLFDYTTDIKLLELGNLNHPLLKKLIVEAPGTYHHSIIVGSLVESAAESIHANPLLARVAAYYHDIGKLRNSIYFGENQSSDDNPHDRLSPNMSVLILLSHVKEGRELAKQHHLGSDLTEIISQHHGTSLIRYFWMRAQEQKERGENVNDNEQDFRYPGPKPQTREAGLVMLADSVEAATRSLQKPTPERIQGVVQRVINMIFRDGQLNECELTLKDLHQIARAFTATLIGLYHNRPVYPGKKEEKPSNGGSGSQQTKKTAAGFQAMDDDDGEDIKRLGSS